MQRISFKHQISSIANELIRTNIKQKIESTQKDAVQKKLNMRYQKYFKHWKDFDLLTCILALIGLVLSIVDYEYTFDNFFYDENNKFAITNPRNIPKIKEDSAFVRIIVTVTTLFAIAALLFRNWLYTYWIDYKSSMVFYFNLMEEQQRQIDEQTQDDERIQNLKNPKINFVKESQCSKFMKTILSLEFIFELTILLIHPYAYLEKAYDFKIIDMLDTKSTYIVVTYTLSDFLFAFMFLRVYFLIRTILNLSRYSDLFSKRVCSKYNVENGIGFHFKALFTKNTTLTVFFSATISILWLSYLLRIFERVYYRACGQIVFDDLSNSLWCVIITMTTVGYGDIYAVSPFGKVISILNALWGAFIISLLVGTIALVISLSEDQKKALAEITNAKQAAVSLRTYIKYINAKSDREKHEQARLENQFYEADDYVPSMQEVLDLKQETQKQSELFREERSKNQDLLPSSDSLEIQNLKEELTNLNDKFDLLLIHLFRQKARQSFDINSDRDSDLFTHEEAVEFTENAKKRIEDRKKKEQAKVKETLVKKIIKFKQEEDQKKKEQEFEETRQN